MRTVEAELVASGGDEVDWTVDEGDRSAGTGVRIIVAVTAATVAAVTIRAGPVRSIDPTIAVKADVARAAVPALAAVVAESRLFLGEQCATLRATEAAAAAAVAIG